MRFENPSPMTLTWHTCTDQHFGCNAVYEGYERFEEVAHILKERYGAALRDLVPTAASATYLYGDSLKASDRIARFRRELFGAKGAS